jgi:exopolyphosphatase/guanosine-5'-triphosphate,3'-diphosphate pyrophosphatase
LVDFFLRQQGRDEGDNSLTDAALTVGRRFGFDEAHARQVARIALALFDDLASLHGLPAAARPLLEMAGLLHDIGNAVSYQRHHKHTQYLIQNADIPGMGDRERDLAGRIARFHRRSFPDASHPAMEGLTGSDVRTVRKLATLLRVADSLDRGHRQAVQRVRARAARDAVHVRVRARTPLDLELWDASHEEVQFRRVFGRKLIFQVERGGRVARA